MRSPIRGTISSSLTRTIQRSYADEGELPPEEEEEPEDLNLRRLQPGEVLVAYHSPPGHREILLEADLNLVDRMFQLGDLCKRNIDDLQSGVVVRVETQAQLHHAISGERVEGWFKLEDMQEDEDVCVGDYVVHNDWIGQVRLSVLLGFGKLTPSRSSRYEDLSLIS